VLLLLKWKFEENKVRRKTRETWIDDLLKWRQKNKYHKVARLAEDRER